MQLSHTVPTKYLDLSAKYSSYFLVLAHLVGEDKEYTKFFQEQRKMDKYLVLDNGAYELGKALPNDEIIKRAGLLDAQEMVCPDVFRDGEETWKRTSEFVKTCQEKKINRKLMIVPQGNSYPEYENCLMEMWSFQDSVHTIGLGFLILAKVGSEFTGLDEDLVYPNRVMIMRRKIMKFVQKTGWNAHLLGLGNAGAQELAEIHGKWEKVTRCDTSSAFALALEGRSMRKEGTEYDRTVTKLDFALELPEASLSAAQKKTKDEVLLTAADNMIYLNEFAEEHMGRPVSV